MAVTVILFIIIFIATELSGLYSYNQAELICVVLSPLPKYYVFLYGVFRKAYKSLLFTFIFLVLIGYSAVRVFDIPLLMYLVISMGIILLLVIYLALIILLNVFVRRITRIIACSSLVIIMGWVMIRQILSVNAIDYFGLIPFSGWNYFIISHAIFGLTGKTQVLLFLSITLTVGFLVATMLVLRRVDVFELLYTRKAVGPKRERESVSLPIGGKGAWVIFCKQLVEHRHRGWYLFFDVGALITSSFICVVAYAIMSSVTETGEVVPAIYAYGANAIFQLLFSMTLFDCLSIKAELASAHVRLFPIAPLRKMLAISLLPFLKKGIVSTFFIVLVGWFTGTSATLVLLTLSSFLFAVVNLVFLEFLPIGRLLVQDQMEENIKTLIWGIVKIGFGLVALLPSFAVFTFFLFTGSNIWGAFFGFNLASIMVTLLICILYRNKAF